MQSVIEGVGYRFDELIAGDNLLAHALALVRVEDEARIGGAGAGISIGKTHSPAHPKSRSRQGENEAALFMRQFARRHGEAALERWRQRIEAADAETLLEWRKRLLFAPTPEEVFKTN